jgi:hypothetical protein
VKRNEKLLEGGDETSRKSISIQNLKTVLFINLLFNNDIDQPDCIASARKVADLICYKIKSVCKE